MVCAEVPEGNFPFGEAREITSGMFARIGVRVQWHRSRECPAGAIQVSFVTHTPDGYRPGALAYATPYERTHIVVLLDRVERDVPFARLAVLMAHVLAHEITHIVEGVSRHSNTGLMKAHWGPEDYCQMFYNPLPFAPEDITLIELGLEKRETLAATNGMASGVPAELAKRDTPR